MAQALKERGAGQSITGWTLSGLSTPNNSPDVQSPEGSPAHFFHSTLELLHQGARMIRRTWTGKKTPVHRSVPRISREELEVLHFNQIIHLNKNVIIVCLTGFITNEFIGQIGKVGSR